jgi:multiple sugar transport system substrate-binding protein
MKKVVVLIAVLMTVLAFSKTKVVFWHSMGGGQGNTLKELTTLFNEQHPDIDVELVYVGNYSTLQQKLLASAQSGGLPTISQAYSNWTAKMIPSGLVQDLNYLLNDPKIGMSKAEWEDVYKPLRENCYWGDKLYAIPFNKSIYILYYNADMLSLYGVDVPESMNELYMASKILTDDTNGDGTTDQYGFAFRTTVDTFQIFLTLRGGKILTQKDGKWVCTINSDASRDVLNFFLKELDDGAAFAQGGYLNDIFGEGKIAMYIDTIAGRAYVESSSKGKFTWKWAPVPLWQTRNVPFAGTDIIMFSSATSEEQKAAWEYMKYLIEPESTAYWSIKTGYLPVRKSALETTIWTEAAKSDPLLSIPLSQLDSAAFDPQIGVWNEIRTVVGTMFSNVINKKVTVDEGLQLAEKQINEYLKEEQ